MPASEWAVRFGRQDDAPVADTVLNGGIGLDLASTDAYANMRVIRNATSIHDQALYLGYGQSGITYLFGNGQQTARCEGTTFYVSGGCRASAYFYTDGTIQAMNAYYFPNNIWNKSNDGLDRLTFTANGKPVKRA